jgi:hypothetical protein
MIRESACVLGKVKCYSSRNVVKKTLLNLKLILRLMMTMLLKLTGVALTADVRRRRGTLNSVFGRRIQQWSTWRERCSLCV